MSSDLSDNTLSHHGVCNLFKACNVGAHDVVALVAVAGCGVDSIVVNVDHDVVKLFASTSSKVQDSLSEFWDISRAEVATPPALEALPWGEDEAAVR